MNFISQYIYSMSFTIVSIEAVLVLTLLFHTNGVILVFSSSASADHGALVAIKSKIADDPLGALRSWNDSLPFCRWQGVTCGRSHQRVTVLNLSDTGLVGSLSPYIGNLGFLRFIIIKSNQLNGNIPPEVGRLYRLQALYLPNNSFTGEIPANLSSCSKLWFIDLSFNMLSGKIPNIFSSLLMMKKLFLHKNIFTGGIPESIGNLTSLQELSLSSNPLLGGSIPDSFNQLKNLQRLSLEDNGLVGAFPQFLFNLSMLQILHFQLNQLQGSLPSTLCSSQPYLRSLILDNNNFSGILPPSISNCSELEIFDVSINDFHGGINIDFGKLQYLQYLGLGPNNFGSKGLNGLAFFDSLSNCSNLDTLELINSQLTGVLPDSLGNFSSQLNYIGLYGNYISGSVPSSIGNLIGLTELNFDQNSFTGMIPETIGKLQNMERLYLDNNAFSGIIPPSIGNLSFLTEIALGGNNLEGPIPSTFGSFKRLLYLDLYRNNLGGNIPREIFQLSSLSIVLDLSQNNLSGMLPQEIGNLKNIGYLDLSQNRLSGELPSSFRSCISLQTLNLSENFFQGSLPEALGTLRGLESVNPSRNNFSGRIPTYMKEMALKYLDLSYNNFEGEVSDKGVFANTSSISVKGNHRLCGGILELQLPECSTNDSKRSKKLSVRAVLAISLSSTFAGLALVSFVMFYCCIKKKRDKPSEINSSKFFEKISYGRLFKATGGFSSENLIGAGSFASVYKGVVDEYNLTVAIKVLNLQRRGGSKSFIAECDALRNTRHRNLVKVITSCSSIDFQGNAFKALVYEFMPNGNLESWLHSTERKLDLFQRINIIKDVACALDYLHCRCENVVVHCDLKPTNILLDADMVAHVGYFGLAKILSLEEVSNANKNSSSITIGTVGYAPPEYGLGNEVSTSGDIYSYGILLLEMLTGKKPVDPMFEEGLSLHSYVRSALADGFARQIVDPVLLNKSVSEQSLISLVKIGVQCSSESPQDRMDIETVVHELFSITGITSYFLIFETSRMKVVQPKKNFV